MYTTVLSTRLQFFLQLFRCFDIPVIVNNSSWISCAILLNNNTLLTTDYNSRITKWIIDGDNLKLKSMKENAHSDEITTICKIGNGLMLTGSKDNLVKIW